MLFTALHRLLGRSPGPLTNEMIDAAVAEGVTETDDLDWKAELPPTKSLNETDFPKDIAAMANTGGGVIVYGVTENEKKATGRSDTGKLTENHERTLRSAALTAISPPVFGLEIVRLGEEGNQCVAVVVPASVDGPHLIYKNELFGAPVRNNADTVWMKERQIEAAYRTRLEERRNATRALHNLFADVVAGRDTSVRAWLVAVARPHVMPTTITRWDRDEARGIFDNASRRALTYATRQGVRPFEIFDILNPRPGLRGWVAARSQSAGGDPTWKEARASVHFDGSVALVFGLGGLRNGRDSYLPGGSSTQQPSRVQLPISWGWFGSLGNTSVRSTTKSASESSGRVRSR
jgi:Putative DNA-binding domain